MTGHHDEDCDGNCESCDDHDHGSSSCDGHGPDGGHGPVRPSIYTDARAEMRRRDYAKALATVGGLTAVGSLAAPLAGLQRVFQRKYTGPVFGDGVPLVDLDGDRIREEQLSPGEQITVVPEPRPGIERAPTLLVRYEESAYGGDTNMAFTTGGYAAYSKICTHAGCMVDDNEGSTLVCPCHYGKFDPKGGASVVGGPPPRSLPQLPITVSSGGYLVATGDFEAPVGAGGE